MSRVAKTKPPRKPKAPAAVEAPKKWHLRLYVAGQTPRSVAAMANLKNMCEEHLAGQYCIEVIDLVKTRNWRWVIKYSPFRRLSVPFRSP